MDTIIIITNIPSPYRVDLYYFMQKTFTNYNIHVIYMNRTGGTRVWSIDESKLLNSHFLETKVIQIKKKMDDRYIHLPANVGKLLNDLLPDVVISMEYSPTAFEALWWCKKNNKKYIHVTDGTLFSERSISKLQKLTRKAICKHADAFIASSTKAKEKLLYWGAPADKIFISLLTVDISRFHKKNPLTSTTPPSILYVGSMDYRKGVDLLIQSLPFIKTDYTLHLVGNGTEKEIKSLMDLSVRLGVSSNIKWSGFLDGNALLDAYQEASLFVLPTREDCFGLVLLEAYCTGIPIVSSKYADGAYDIISNGVNGIICDPYNSKSFATALSTALSSSDMRKNALNNDCSRFSFYETTKAYSAAIESIM